MFWWGSNVAFSAILDGTSNTVVMSETLLGLGYDSTGPVPVDPTRQACRYPGGGMGNPGQGFTGAPGNNPNLAAAVAANTPPYWQGNRGFAWSWMKEQSTTFNTYAPPNNPVPDVTRNRFGWLDARSHHPGGVNAALADGSVRFVSNTVALATWHALATIAGGEVLGQF